LTIIVDASVVVSSLIDGGPTGRWAESLLAEEQAIAPHLMPAEAANILRRASLAGAISGDLAGLAHAEVARFPSVLVPYAPLADRIWELRGNVTAYDAWYVALAEALGLRLATLDRRLASATGPRCGFLLPPVTGPARGARAGS
jgi:predicted nucleic acid-binding protein